MSSPRTRNASRTALQSALQTALQTVTAVFVAGALAACGGGGSAGAVGASPVAPGGGGSGSGGGTGGGTGDSGGDLVAGMDPVAGGIDRSGVTVGTISGFGSVFVGGVQYDTDDAMFLDDGAPATEADFSVGQIVQIEGSRNEDGLTGVADRVRFEAEVEGPVSAVDVLAGSFVVLGRTIRTDVETRFDDDFVPASLEALTVGTSVEVSGFVTADGAVLATSVEREDDLDLLKVRGAIQALDTDTLRFMIGDLTVDYALATLRGFGGAAIADGDRVRVLGEALDEDGVLIATVVSLRPGAILRRDDDDDGDDDDGSDDVEIEGLITELAVDGFTVARQQVRIDDDTEFENGTFDDLTIDLRVEVEGTLDADGVLLAEEVELRRRANAELEGLVDSIDVDANALVVAGVTVTVTRTTQFEDDSDEDIRRFSLADLNVGDFVEIKGLAADGAILARRIERDDGDDDDDGAELALDGGIDGFGTDSVTMLGFELRFAADTEFELNDNEVTEAQFRAAVSAGDRVEVEARQDASGDFIVDEIEKDDDGDSDEDDD